MYFCRKFLKMKGIVVATIWQSQTMPIRAERTGQRFVGTEENRVRFCFGAIENMMNGTVDVTIKNS